MTQLVLPSTIDTATAIASLEYRNNYDAIAAVINGGLEGGATAAGNFQADTLTARELAANSVTAGQLADDSVAAAGIAANAVTPAKTTLQLAHVQATGVLVLTTTLTDVPGATLTTNAGVTGDYLVLCVYDFNWTTLSSTWAGGALMVGGVAQGPLGVHSVAGRVTLTQIHYLTAVPNATVVKMRGNKGAASGVGNLEPQHTTLSMIGPL